MLIFLCLAHHIPQQPHRTPAQPAHRTAAGKYVMNDRGCTVFRVQSYTSFNTVRLHIDKKNIAAVAKM